MAAVLKRLVEGDLNVDEFKLYLKTGKTPESLTDYEGVDQVNHTTEFVTYFLNYIREESSHHFTADLPLISPKKIKKRKKVPRPRTSGSDTSNESVRSSARGSLFSTPPSAKLGNVNLSPVAGGQQDKSKISPGVSPSVKHHSHNSSDELRDMSQVTSTPLKFNLDEDFPPVCSQKMSKRKTPSRRITPTPARSSYTRRSPSNIFNSSAFESSQDSERSFSSEKSKHYQKHGNNVNFVGSASPKNVRRSSAKLKLEDFMQQGSRNRGKSSSDHRQNSREMSTSSELDESNNSCDVSQFSFLDTSKDEVCQKRLSSPCVVPRRDQVTQAHILDILAKAHSFCIRENLVPNMVVEICFILQLLTVQGNEEKESGLNSGFLKTVHNCVYYAIHVLENVVRIIKLLDKGTLRLLLDNPRVNEFSTILKDELNKVYPTISLNKVPYSLVKSPLNSVPFQASIDNRNNFSTDQAFHSFRRQRDTFYEIIREWEEFRGKPGWSLEDKLGNKIRCVVHQKAGLANHSHFVRLFQSQLIQMCCYENTFPSFNEGESPEIVGNLLKSNPEKFFRLQQRLVTPLSNSAGPCPSPGFTETEEFFREFIVSAMCPPFNRYLMDSFIAKIIELNDMGLSDSLENSIQAEISEDEKDKLQVKFASCLITLRTLAKFLGFLVFSPYHLSIDLPPAVKNNLITARNQEFNSKLIKFELHNELCGLPSSQPSNEFQKQAEPDYKVAQQLDIMFYLRKAHEEQRLVLTLPWIIEYLSMIDTIGPFLDYYNQVFHVLHYIYRVTLLRKTSFDMNRNNLMLSIGLGWLFEMPSVPEIMFSKSSGDKFSESEKINSGFNLDNMDLVDQNLLYTCCPYLGELRSILAEAVIGKATKRGSVKKIKPICADKVQASSSSSRLLQTQLEDNFFRNQPEFLKKIVDFVIARIYHNMVSMIKNYIITTQLEGAMVKLNADSNFKLRDWQEIGKEGFKEKNKGLILKIINKTTDGTLERVSSEVDKECKCRSLDALHSLTPQDMDDVVVKTAAGIVHQSAMNKLMEWSHQHLPDLIEMGLRQDIDKMITKDSNLPVNNYRLQAEDPDNPFNWFYQQLLEKANEAHNQPSTSVSEAEEKVQQLVENAKEPEKYATIAVNEEEKQ